MERPCRRPWLPPVQRNGALDRQSCDSSRDTRQASRGEPPTSGGANEWPGWTQGGGNIARGNTLRLMWNGLSRVRAELAELLFGRGEVGGKVWGLLVSSLVAWPVCGLLRGAGGGVGWGAVEGSAMGRAAGGLAARLMCAGWCRRRALRRELPHTDRDGGVSGHSRYGDRFGSGGCPAHGGVLAHAQPGRQASGTGGHVRRRSSRPTRTRRVRGRWR